MDRDQIIQAVQAHLEPLPYVYAMWLEGADATGYLDEYSDIDFNVDFEDAMEEQVIRETEAALSALGMIDFQYNMPHPHPKLRQRVYHIEGTNEYLWIDFCWQLHSRKKEECRFLRGSRVEQAAVLFDKTGVVQYIDEIPEKNAAKNSQILDDCKYRFSQHSRVLKYIRRGEYLEAYLYYNRYVLDPLVSLLRMRYTPAHVDYHLIHISHHLPEEEVRKLETFAQVPTFADLEEKTVQAQNWFNTLLEHLE